MISFLRATQDPRIQRIIGLKGCISDIWLALQTGQYTQRTQTFLRRLQDVLKRSWRLTTKLDVVTTSCKRHLIYDVLKTSDVRRLENFRFTTSWRSPIYEVLKIPDLRRLEDAWFITLWRRLIYDVWETSDLIRLEDVRFTTSWRRLIYDVLKTFDLRRLEDVCKTTPL